MTPRRMLPSLRLAVLLAAMALPVAHAAPPAGEPAAAADDGHGRLAGVFTLPNIAVVLLAATWLTLVRRQRS